MKNKVKLMSAVLLILAVELFMSPELTAQTTDTTKNVVNPGTIKHGRGFVDKNSDGINDRRDADGDGIPNWKDPDFVPPGQGKRFFIDENGDGINDLRQDFDDDGVVNRKDRDYLQNHGQIKRRMGFIDANGDGINDLIQDADGDGIRNIKDPDWTKPAGTGRGARGMGQGSKK